MRMMRAVLPALFALFCSLHAAAQEVPDEPPPTMVPDVDTSAPPAPPPRHHHRMVQVPPQAGGESWVHEPGTGMSGPASDRASNITGSDSGSAIAPHLPEPPGGQSAGWRNTLRDADRALAANRTGEAQQALEMAETRLLDRSTPVDRAGEPSQSPAVQEIARARQALGSGDLAGARAAIRTALGQPEGGEAAPAPRPYTAQPYQAQPYGVPAYRRPYPAQPYPAQPYPTQAYPAQPYEPQPYPTPYGPPPSGAPPQ